MKRLRKVGVLMGGVSSERDVSLDSGAAVVKGLLEAGYDAVPVILDAPSVGRRLDGFDAAFIALHGGYGEDGGVQADLDRLGVPYTGSGAAASRLAMDKILTKECLRRAGVPTADYEVLDRDAAHTRLPLPVVVKPPCEGSSVGVGRVFAAPEWAAALASARRHDPAGRVLVETFLPGREWTVGVLGDTALPVIEIRAPGDFYDYEAKYADDRPVPTAYVFPEGHAAAPLTRACRDLALAAFRAAGCRGFGRVDFRVLPDGRPFVLEINTVPGFTSHSLLPMAAARAGIGFAALCGRILRLARCDRPEAKP